MKILFLGRYNPGEIVSGPERFARSLFDAVRARGHECRFVEYFFKDSEESSLTTRLTGRRSLSGDVLRAGILPLFGTIRSLRPDVLHVVTGERFLIPLLLGRSLLHGTIVTTFHGILARELDAFPVHRGRGAWSRRKDIVLEQLLVGRSDRLVFLTERQADEAEDQYSFDRSRARVIPMGIDDRLLSVQRRPADAGVVRCFCYHRAGIEEESLPLLIGVLRDAAPCGVELSVLGGTAETTENGGSVRITSVPKMGAVALAGFLAGQQFYFNLARNDTFPLMSLESMAAGVVPVLSAGVGTSTLITQGVNGFVCEPRDRASLVALVRDVLGRRNEFEALSARARESVAAFTWTSIAARYEELYSSLVNRETKAAQ